MQGHRGAPEGFNKRLYDVIIESNISMVALAERTGISRRTLHYIRDGESNPDLVTLARLCAVTGVSADYLLFGREGTKNGKY